MLSNALPWPTFYPRIVFSGAYAYASGPTGTAVFPAAFDVTVNWSKWSPFSGANLLVAGR